MSTPFNNYGIAFGTTSLEEACAKWFAYPGQAWQITAKLDKSEFEISSKIAASVFDGKFLPQAPGPFKQLAAFAVAAQYRSPFTLTNGDGSALSAEELAHWNPRLTVWALTFLGERLRVNNEALPFPIAFPSLHTQIEILNYLRNLYRSANKLDPIDSDILAERVTLLALIIETSTYASFPDVKRLEPISKLATNCVSQYSIEDPRWPDLVFMNETFLEAAVGIGIS